MPKRPPDTINLRGMEGWRRKSAWAEKLGIHERTLMRWVEEGSVRVCYFGNAAYLHEDDIVARVEASIVERNPERVSA